MEYYKQHYMDSPEEIDGAMSSNNTLALMFFTALSLLLVAYFLRNNQWSWIRTTYLASSTDTDL